ncbi:hypothetical protein [Planobispora rosea]|nr:hypothetical protein [Planobispora rosea]
MLRLRWILVLSLALTPMVLTPAAHATEVRQICRVTFEITIGQDGLRDDSEERISLGGQEFLFEDPDGDGVLDENRDGAVDEAPVHRGGTGDIAGAAFRWNGRLADCVSSEALLDGFTLSHRSPSDDISADNWNLQALKIIDRADGVILVDLTSRGPAEPCVAGDPRPPGDPVFRFCKNAHQTFNTNQGRPDADTDGDGLTDRVELRGIPKPDDTLDTWLPDHGSDPCRKTLAVEIDWLADGTVSDRPDPAALAEARHMFDTAPIEAAAGCPYGTGGTGIQLLIDESNEITVSPEQRRRPLLGRGDQERDWDFTAYRTANFPAWRQGFFFYNLWGYRHNGTTSGGSSGHGPKDNDFVVTLGVWKKKSVRTQSATFVHELGHALALRHGGMQDEPNFKPNYLSVMNYRYATIGLPDWSAWREALDRIPQGTDFVPEQVLESVSTIDYSRDVLRPLFREEDPPYALNESAGVGGGTDTVVAWWDDKAVLHVGPANGPLDWDWSGKGTADPDPAHRTHADLLSGFQECIGPEDPSPGGTRNGLDTPVHPDDIAVSVRNRGTVILSGPDGVCDSPVTAGDTSRSVRDYPREKKYGREGEWTFGILGFDDWAAVKFRIGVSPDAGQPLPEPGEPAMTEEERDRTVGELVDALLAAEAPALSPTPRWAYAYMDRATVAEAPIGVVTELTPIGQWSTGGTGATVTHTGTGAYEVRLPGVASARGIAHVTAYRTVYRGRTCAVTGFEPSGADELVRVQCRDQAGEPVDWWFTVLFTAPSATGHPYATIQHSGSPTAPGTYNSDGRVNRVLHDGTGRYRAVIPGGSFTRGTGHIKLTPYGTTAARCAARPGEAAGDTLEIGVSCYAIATGRPVDARWLLSYADGGGAAAYTRVTGGPAVDPVHSYSVTGETPGVERLGIGWYRVTWERAGRLFGSAQITSMAADGNYCHLGGVFDYGAPPRVSIDVYCHTPEGMRADSEFGVAYLRRPA